MQDKEWSCNNQCGTNCCQELFLILTPAQKLDYETQGYYFVSNKQFEWRWLGYRKKVTYEKIDKKTYKIMVDKEAVTKVIFNDVVNKWILWVKDECSKLKKDNKCGVYRNRPLICKIGQCPVFSSRPSIKWLANNGLLKDVRKKLNPD